MAKIKINQPKVETSANVAQASRVKSKVEAAKRLPFTTFLGEGFINNITELKEAMKLEPLVFVNVKGVSKMEGNQFENYKEALAFARQLEQDGYTHNEIFINVAPRTTADDSEFDDL